MKSIIIIGLVAVGIYFLVKKKKGKPKSSGKTGKSVGGRSNKKMK